MTTTQWLRHEARLMRATANKIWLSGEDLIAQATKLNERASALEAEAEDAEEAAKASEWIGPVVRPRKARAA